MNTTLSLGETIKIFRTHANISQLKLELHTNSSPGSISRIENSKTNPTKETIARISNALNITNREFSWFNKISTSPSKNKHILTLREGRISDIDIDVLKQRLISDLLAQTDYYNGYLTSLFFKLVNDNQRIKLITLSNSYILHTMQPRLSNENAYDTSPIQNNTSHNFTTQATIIKKVIYHSDLTKFISPPLSKQTVKLIQKLFAIRSMVAIPLVNKQSNCFGVVNIALNKNINMLSISDKQNFDKVGKNLSREVSKIMSMTLT